MKLLVKRDRAEWKSRYYERKVLLKRKHLEGPQNSFRTFPELAKLQNL